MHNNQPIYLVVFDCDGVILESVDVKTKAFGLVVKEYGTEAVARLMEYHASNGGVSRYEKFEWFFREVLGREITPTELNMLGERFQQISFDGVINAPMVNGALECIQELYHLIPIYVASGAPQKELTAVLNERNLSPYFKGAYGSPPGKTDLLRRILHQTGAEPEKTIMVGDSSTDLDAAQACGTCFFGRGDYFKLSGWPWSKDLNGFLAHIRTRLIQSRVGFEAIN